METSGKPMNKREEWIRTFCLGLLAIVLVPWLLYGAVVLLFWEPVLALFMLGYGLPLVACLWAWLTAQKHLDEVRKRFDKDPK